MHPAASVAEMPPGSCKRVDLDGTEVVLFNVEGEFYALDNDCPHEGGPLAEGKLRGGKIFCPWHSWAINVKTGQAVSYPEYRARRHGVRVEHGNVYVELEDDDTD